MLTDLANSKHLVSVKDHEMQIPRCSRTGDIIELILKEQWFIDCKDMAAKAYQAVEQGKLKLEPSFHNQTWFDWLNGSSTRCVQYFLLNYLFNFKVDKKSFKLLLN